MLRPHTLARFFGWRSKTCWLRAMATSVLKQQQLPWTTAKLVPEALLQRLHVVEDPALIALLGRSKFVDMVVSGAPGWQHGVSIYLFPFRVNGDFVFPSIPAPLQVYSRVVVSVKLNCSSPCG